MLFGATFEDDSGRKYRFIFLSNCIAGHLLIDSVIRKSELEELIEHTEADAKAHRGIDLEDYFKAPDIKSPKERLKPRFILFRIFDKRKEEEELKKERFDIKSLSKSNKKTLKKMLTSDYDSFRVIQSETLASAHDLDLFINQIKKDEKLYQDQEKETSI